MLNFTKYFLVGTVFLMALGCSAGSGDGPGAGAAAGGSGPGGKADGVDPVCASCLAPGLGPSTAEWQAFETCVGDFEAASACVQNACDTCKESSEGVVACMATKAVYLGRCEADMGCGACLESVAPAADWGSFATCVGTENEAQVCLAQTCSECMLFDGSYGASCLSGAGITQGLCESQLGGCSACLAGGLGNTTGEWQAFVSCMNGDADAAFACVESTCDACKGSAAGVAACMQEKAVALGRCEGGDKCAPCLVSTEADSDWSGFSACVGNDDEAAICVAQACSACADGFGNLDPACLAADHLTVAMCEPEGGSCGSCLEGGLGPSTGDWQAFVSCMGGDDDAAFACVESTCTTCKEEGAGVVACMQGKHVYLGRCEPSSACSSCLQSTDPQTDWGAFVACVGNAAEAEVCAAVACSECMNSSMEVDPSCIGGQNLSVDFCTNY
jgi:hypothetical protein